MNLFRIHDRLKFALKKGEKKEEKTIILEWGNKNNIQS